MDLNQDIPCWLSLVFILGGLFLLGWSADRFVAAAARLARAVGISALIVGMVVIGFGTSAPELVVSVLSGIGGHSNLSLGNAYGSCIFNIAVILGVAALIAPIKVKKSTNIVGVPLLGAVTALSYFLVRDMKFERMDGVILLVAFLFIMPAYCIWDQRQSTTRATRPTAADVPEKSSSAVTGFRFLDCFWLLVGLALLVASSHVLVWGCVDFARDVLHVSDLMIGLTVVAMGTSLPELASAIASARRHEHEFVIGNIIGSNLFNALAVVGIAGTISPFENYSQWIVYRDVPTMILLTLMLGMFAFNWRRPRQNGRIWRWQGALWLLVFVVYLCIMISQEKGAVA